ncbi:MAG: hypothetical protein GF335_02270 [Candidatus Moranbacteria bacterium]|nr:hypothetical protein [Candidatus Moranbacteria bacterium]
MQAKEPTSEALDSMARQYNSESTKVIKALDQAREKYILSQLKAEKGIFGFFRKLGFKFIQSIDKLDYYVEAKNNYYKKLEDYRDFIIKRFNQNKKEVEPHDIAVIAKITIFDEIKKLRRIKEEKLRDVFVLGIFRAQVQEWREISTGFKMGLGTFFMILGISLSYISFLNYFWLKIFVIAGGIMIFSEGAIQRLTQHRAEKKGLNRYKAFLKARRRIPRTTENLSKILNKIHQDLEQEIWKIRIYEKKTEFSRYLIAFIIGFIIISLPLIPYGAQTSIASAISAVFSRMIWFLIPYGSIRAGIFEIFKVPQVKANELIELNAGEGSESFDPVLTKAMESSARSVVTPFSKISPASSPFFASQDEIDQVNSLSNGQVVLQQGNDLYDLEDDNSGLTAAKKLDLDNDPDSDQAVLKTQDAKDREIFDINSWYRQNYDPQNPDPIQFRKAIEQTGYSLGRLVDMWNASNPDTPTSVDNLKNWLNKTGASDNYMGDSGSVLDDFSEIDDLQAKEEQDINQFKRDFFDI